MSFQFLSRFKNSQKSPKTDFITIVSGLPRSGTSMMMKMLEAGGIQVVTDNLRTADDSNPKGYYEFERVKKLKDGDLTWLKDAQGKCVKVISALLEYLPSQYTYKVIFMRRNMDEILASQRQMLLKRGEATDKISDEKMAELFQNHLEKVEAWLCGQTNMETYFVSYNDMLANPKANLDRLCHFLGKKLDLQRMTQIIDKDLYRQRNPS